MSWVVLPPVTERDKELLDEHVHEYGLVGANGQIARLHHWWCAVPFGTLPEERDVPRGSAAARVTPVSQVIFVNSGITQSHYLHVRNTRIPRTYEEMYYDDLYRCTPAEAPYVVFYSLPGSWSEYIFILGGYSHAKLVDAESGQLTIGNLMQTRSYFPDLIDETPVATASIATAAASTTIVTAPLRQPLATGSRNRNMWYNLPFHPPLKATDTASNAECTIDDVNYRWHLMLKFWKYRKDVNFVDKDSKSILVMLHEGIQTNDDDDSGNLFFELTTDIGRGRESASYWANAWACAHKPVTWARWAHFEQLLTRFRVERYFCSEKHFALFIQTNNLVPVTTIDVDSGIHTDEYEEDIAYYLEDPGDRERELYRLRWPDGKLPTIWLSVPVAQVGKRIAENPLYDIDGGRVIITYRDFADWVWSRQEIAANRLIKEIYARQRVFGKNRKTADQSNLGTLLNDTMSEIERVTQEEVDAENDARKKRRAQTERTMVSKDGKIMIVDPGKTPAISSFDTGKVADLLELARVRMPPCMGRHIWRAVVHGIHPKHEARVSLVKFLLEADYSIEEIERVMYLLYESDKKYVQQCYPHTGWNADTFKKEYGGQVKQLHTSVMVDKRIGAYGCASLTSPEKRDKANGCPFAVTGSGAMMETRSYLGWAGVTDIEDVMRFKHPQERCCRYYIDRHPEDDPIVIKHPNQFFRGSKTPGRVISPSLPLLAPTETMPNPLPAPAPTPPPIVDGGDGGESNPKKLKPLFE